MTRCDGGTEEGLKSRLHMKMKTALTAEGSSIVSNTFGLSSLQIGLLGSSIFSSGSDAATSFNYYTVYLSSSYHIQFTSTTRQEQFLHLPGSLKSINSSTSSILLWICLTLGTLISSSILRNVYTTDFISTVKLHIVSHHNPHKPL